MIHHPPQPCHRLLLPSSTSHYYLGPAQLRGGASDGRGKDGPAGVTDRWAPPSILPMRHHSPAHKCGKLTPPTQLQPTHPVVHIPPSPSRSSCPPPPLACCAMASLTGSAVSFAKPVKAINTNSLSFSGARRGNAFLRMQPVPMRFSVCCSAKQDTVEKVCEIVKKQLAVPEGTEVCGTTKFSDLGADSLDTVEIVMGLEEEFQISVEETSAQAIATVEDAATLIDKLVSAKSS